MEEKTNSGLELSTRHKVLYALIGSGQNLIIYGFMNLYKIIEAEVYDGNPVTRNYFMLLNFFYLLAAVQNSMVGCSKISVFAGLTSTFVGLLIFAQTFFQPYARTVKLIDLCGMFAGFGYGLVMPAMYSLGSKNRRATRIMSIAQSLGGLCNVVFCIAVVEGLKRFGVSIYSRVLTAYISLCFSNFMAVALFLSLSPLSGTLEQYQLWQRTCYVPIGLDAQIGESLIEEQPSKDFESDMKGIFNAKYFLFYFLTYFLQFVKGACYPIVAPGLWHTGRDIYLIFCYQCVDGLSKIAYGYLPPKNLFHVICVYVANAAVFLMIVLAAIVRHPIINNFPYKGFVMICLAVVNNYGNESAYNELMKIVPKRQAARASSIDYFCNVAGILVGSIVGAKFLEPYLRNLQKLKEL